jgi:hypothetical protein
VEMQDREHLNKLKGLVNNHSQWDNFEKYLDTLINNQHRIMEQTEDAVALHRAQGAIYQLRRLKLLRDEVLKNA